MHPTLIASFDAPHLISIAYADTREILGYHEDYLCGRTIEVFFGDRTDVSRFSSAIANTYRLQTASIQLQLYDSSRQCRVQLVTFSPHFDLHGQLRGCHITLQSSEIVSKDRSIMENSASQVVSLLIDANPGHPHTIKLVNNHHAIDRPLMLAHFPPIAFPENIPGFARAAAAPDCMAEWAPDTFFSGAAKIHTAVTCVTVAEANETRVLSYPPICLPRSPPC